MEMIVSDEWVIASGAACRRCWRIGAFGTRRVTKDPLRLARLARIIHERFCCNGGFAAPSGRLQWTSS